MGESKLLNLLCKGVQITKETPVTISIILLIIIAGLIAAYMMVPLHRAFEKTSRKLKGKLI